MSSSPSVHGGSGQSVSAALSSPFFSHWPDLGPVVQASSLGELPILFLTVPVECDCGRQGGVDVAVASPNPRLADLAKRILMLFLARATARSVSIVAGSSL